MRMTAVESSETNVSALTKRLYPNLSGNALKKAEAALLKANPHLTESATLQPGATVVLPTIPGVKPKRSAASDDPVDDILSQLRDATDDYEEVLAARLETMTAELSGQEAILKKKEVAAAIKASPEAAEKAKSLSASLRERKRLLAEEKKTQKELFALIKEDLSKIFG